MTTIRVAETSEWTAAIELLHGDLDKRGRATAVLNSLSLLGSGEIPAQGVLVAAEKRRLLGVQLAVVLEGAAGTLLPPAVRHGPDLDLENALVAAGVAHLRERGVKIAHAILPDFSRAAALIRGGLKPITHLLYLRHDLKRLPERTQREWRLKPFDEAQPERFHATLLKTYQKSLDCPELNDTRTVEEIMAGHRAQGDYDPARWLLAESGDLPVGILILNPLRDSFAWDLSYMGVPQHERRQGWGRALIIEALYTAKAGNATEVQVAVDERNGPALGLYRGLGFTEVGRRVVLFMKLGEGDGA